MKDEIKEILDFKEDADYKRLSVDEIVILKDYITNLQTIEQQYSAILSENAELENKITKLQEENKILKENAIHNDKVVDKAKWNEMIYKSRNEKAIKMFNNETLNKYYYGNSYEFAINDFKEDMLNILQGDSND